MQPIDISQENYKRLWALAKTLAKPFPGPDDALDHLWEHYKPNGDPISTVVPQPPRRGGHVSDDDVYEPLLRVLESAGSSGMRPGDAKRAIEPLLASKITDWDQQREPSGMVHWHHRVYSAKEKLMRRGYIAAYGRTKWVITANGIKALETNYFGA